MTPEIDPVFATKIIAMARRLGATSIAQELCSVQPIGIDTATSLHALFDLARNVGYLGLGCQAGCSDLEGDRFDYEVALPADHPALSKVTEVITWAVENLRGSFTYGERRRYTDSLTKLTYTTEWLWRFERLEDSTLFLCAWR